jgi:hypothetical protein
MRRLLLVCWIVSWPVLLLLMLAPIDNGPSWVSDKLVHCVAYGAMTLVAFIATRRLVPFLWMIAVTILLSTSIEFAQGYAPWRQVDPLDIAANLSGIFLAAMIGLTWLSLGGGVGRRATASTLRT